MGAKNLGEEPHGGEATVWSLSWQAISGRDFLASASLVERIRDRLVRAHGSPGRQLLYFVLMPNEIHALTRICGGESVTGITRSFSHVVSRWVREAQTMRGPVFAGPCHIESIGSDADLRKEIRLLAWRPVRLALCKIVAHYPHAALRIAMGAKPGQGFDAGPLRSLFGASKTEARAEIRRCLRTPPSEQEWRVWELTRGLELALTQDGALPFKLVTRPVDPLAASLIAAGGSLRIDDALRLLEDWMIAKIHAGPGFNLHKGSSMLAVRGRALVACLAVSHRLCAAATVARHFARSKATLSEQMKACRSRSADRLILATPLPKIIEEVEALRGRGDFQRHRAGKTR